MQLLESGFLHADPHPGNLLRTPDGRLCVLDFGLMTEVHYLLHWMFYFSILFYIQLRQIFLALHVTWHAC